MSIYALVVAAGLGERAKSATPKQYRRIGGLPVLRRSILPFATHPEIVGVRTVIHCDAAEAYAAATDGLALLDPVVGGETRQQSVRLGLESLAAFQPDKVLIHDAARPFVDGALISRIIAALAEHRGAAAAIHVIDSIKRAPEGVVQADIDRTGLWRTQTPQGFHFDDILAAHRNSNDGHYSDDVGVASASGIAVKLVCGSERNKKITTDADLEQAEQDLANRLTDVRVGFGFDVHRFGADRPLMLCGIGVPHPTGLQGHSDADVGLHAVTDAVLGAIGAGDIGDHFPPSDARWAGAASDLFLRHAIDLVRDQGGEIRLIDLTLICEAPKISPHKQAMRERIADIASIDVNRISIKATTTEGLGFTGRKEGIAAQATATVCLPEASEDV